MKQITNEQAAIFEALLIQNRDNAKLQNITGCSYLESINHLNDLRKPSATPSPLPEKNHTLYVDCSNNKGQMKVSEAKELILSLSKRGEKWVQDFSPFMYVTDETDPDMNNPCALSDGHCWVVSERFSTNPLPETEIGVSVEENGFYLFSKLKPFHNQEIIYWRGGEMKGLFDAKNKQIKGTCFTPKYWKPAPPTPGNERQEGEWFTPGKWEIEAQNNDSWPDIPIWSTRNIGGGTLQNECVATVWASDKTEATARLIASAPAMYRALKRILPIIEAERTQTGVSLSVRYLTEYEEAKAILNSITGGK